MKSQISAKRCYVRFVNQSDRVVEVIWINFKGIEQLYKMLAPRQVYDVNTFETHPWIFRDQINAQVLHANYMDVYYPQQCSVPLVPPRLVNGEMVTTQPVRVMVEIKITVYSLKDVCLYTIRRNLKSKDNISELEIPHTLKEDLAKQWRTI